MLVCVGLLSWTLERPQGFSGGQKDKDHSTSSPFGFYKLPDEQASPQVHLKRHFLFFFWLKNKTVLDVNV